MQLLFLLKNLAFPIQITLGATLYFRLLVGAIKSSLPFS